MKVTYVTLLVLSLAIIIYPCTTVFAEASEEQGKSAATPRLKHDPSELLLERADRILSRLSQTDPEKAEELAKLRAEDPEKFKAALIEVIRTGFARDITAHRKLKSRPGSKSEAGKSIWRNRSDGELSRLMNRTYDEHLEWLKVNYPQQAERLCKLKDERLNSYRKQIRLSLKKYGAIAKASKNNPALAEVLKESLELKEQRDKLLEKIRGSSDEDEKKKLVKELEIIVGRNFVLIAKRKRIEHQQLLGKLQQLQEEVKKNESDVKRWEDAEFRDEKMKTHIKALINGK